MKRRRVPNTISKRMRRRLHRAKDPFMLWLRLRKPVIYARLQRWWLYQLLQLVTKLSPWDFPIFMLAPKVTSNGLISEWKVD